jgi:trehalose 6-phosphate phosphatase
MKRDLGNVLTPADGKQMQSILSFERDWCFFLDVDGTLIGFSEHPNNVHIDTALHGLLVRLANTSNGAIALITGRPITDIDRLFSPLQLPVAGQHGLERRDSAGNLHLHTTPVICLHDAVERLEELTAQYPELVFENKGLTLALHYRRAPALAEISYVVMRQLLATLGGGFELLEGKMLFELKPQGKDKGSAIAEFMKEPPFYGHTPVFIGDDLTDEYGFELVNNFHGHSVKVGVGTTAACWRLADAVAVRAWLIAYADWHSSPQTGCMS